MEADGGKEVVNEEPVTESDCVVKVKAESSFEDSDRWQEPAERVVGIGEMEVDGPVDGCQSELASELEEEELARQHAPQVSDDGGMPVIDEMNSFEDFQCGDFLVDVPNDEIDIDKLDIEFKDLDVAEMFENVDNADPRVEIDEEENAHSDNMCAMDQSAVAIVQPVASDAMSNVTMNAPGFRQFADADLVKASRGEDKPKSANNDRWALRRVDTLRKAMGWDLRIPFGDLPFEQIDILLSNLFARVVKVKGGGTYPAASLMNMLGGYNRIIRRASVARTLSGQNSNIVERDFQIKNHSAFTRTRLTLKAALQKGQKEGANKTAVKKVTVISVAMEEALFADLEHQLTDNRGCQKLLAILLLLQVGIRGGDELWLLDRDCLTVETDNNGREYVKFEERGSKNNCVTIDRYQPEQFRKAYHSYEELFIMCVKQYKRHLPPLAEGTKSDLFLGCINNPVGNIWFIRTAKVGKETAHKWLKNALELVGISGELISNKSGRATLITRLAVSGVPDDIGRLISGHHTLSGYSRYDRSQTLKMEAAQLCTFNPGMDYDKALATVSEKFKEEQMVGTSSNLTPLVDRSERAQELQVALRSELKMSEIPKMQQALMPVVSNVTIEKEKETGLQSENTGESSSCRFVTVKDSPNALAQLHAIYDGIDWEAAIAKDPALARALGGRAGARLNNLGGNSFSNLSNCTIQICVGQMTDGSEDQNKENIHG